MQREKHEFFWEGMCFFLLGTLDLSDVALAGSKRHRKRVRARVKVKKSDYVLVKQLGGCDKETHCQILTLLAKISYSVSRVVAGG